MIVNNKLNKYFIILVFVVSVCLYFYNLGNRPLWDDEAHVAIISSNLLESGKLTGWNGDNLYGYRNGSILNSNLITINPPFDYLVTAASYFFWGKEDNWTSRFPHALFGCFCLILFYFFIEFYFKEENYILRTYSFICFAFSTVFILYIRQCRYYSLSIFFGLLSFYFFVKLLNRKSNKYLYYLLFSSIVLFYVNYLICASFLLTISTIYLIFFLSDLYKPERIKHLSVNILLFIILTVPYSIYNRILVRDDLPNSMCFLQRHIILFYRNFRDINLFYFLPWLIFLIFIVLFFCLKNKLNKTLLKKINVLCLFAFGNVFYISILSFQLIVNGFPFADVRYLIVSIPFFCVIIGFTCYLVHCFINKYIAIVLLTVYLVCNIFSINFSENWNFRWLLPGFVHELFSTSCSGDNEVKNFIVKYIPNKNTIYFFPEYKAYPFMFYLNRKYRFASQIDLNSKISKRFQEDEYNFLFKEKCSPQWIIMYGNTNLHILNYFSRNNSFSNESKYSYHLYAIINNIDIQYIQRPELLFHSFTMNRTQSVYVFKRNY